MAFLERNLAPVTNMHFYSYLDIDMIPSLHLAEEMETFFKNAKSKGRCAYVIPNYELSEKAAFPKNRADFVQLSRRKRPFHDVVYKFSPSTRVLRPGQLGLSGEEGRTLVIWLKYYNSS